jgi:hypothetical protein
LESVFTRLLARNSDIFTGVQFIIHLCAPTPFVNNATRTSSLPAYDYFPKLCDTFSTSTTTSSTSMTTRCHDRLLPEARSTTSTTRTTTS